MPSIFKPKKISNYERHGKALNIYKNVYNTSQWRKLREAYIMEHPLCERCLEENKISPATEVHHVVPISKAQSELQMKELGFNPTNLQALCEKCHDKVHNNLKKSV